MSAKRKKTVAVRYERGKDNAPKVTAKGQGELAEKILELARKNGIPIREDKALLDALYVMEINEEIPEELYQAVAEVLAFVYRMNSLRKGQ